jgi:hypothetical protein
VNRLRHQCWNQCRRALCRLPHNLRARLFRPRQPVTIETAGISMNSQTTPDEDRALPECGDQGVSESADRQAKTEEFDFFRIVLLYPLCALIAGPSLFLLASLCGDNSVIALGTLICVSVISCVIMSQNESLSPVVRNCAAYFLGGTLVTAFFLALMFFLLAYTMRDFD